MGGGKAKAAFAAIGITKDQARELGSLDEALPVIADKIRGLGASAEQAKVAKKLGPRELLPALREGSEAFTGAAAQAQPPHRHHTRFNHRRACPSEDEPTLSGPLVDQIDPLLMPWRERLRTGCALPRREVIYVSCIDY